MNLLNMQNRAQFMNFMRKLNNFCDIRGMEVDTKCKISAKYLQNYASWAKKQGALGVNTTIVGICKKNTK